jgi:hypothetical protein
MLFQSFGLSTRQPKMILEFGHPGLTIGVPFRVLGLIDKLVG